MVFVRLFTVHVLLFTTLSAHMGLNIKKLAADLTRLEVNTILKEDLHCSQPKSNRHMLYEVAQEYRDKLSELDADLHELKLSSDDLEFKWHFAGESSFEEIHKASKKQMQQYGYGLRTIPNDRVQRKLKSDLRTVERIYRQSETILDVFRALKAERNVEEEWNNDISIESMDEVAELQLDARQLTTIRKAHEIGTQQILMQTVVQIDGDITSYITPIYMGLETKEQNMLLEVHNTAFGTSIKVWRYLFETLASLAGGAIGGSLGGKEEKKALKK